MAAPIRRTGKGQILTFRTIIFYVKKVSPKSDVKMADITDSSNFDATTALVWKAQLKVTGQLTLSVEANYDDNITNSLIVQDLFSGSAAGAVVFKLDSGVVFCHGNFDMSEYEQDTPIDDTVTCSYTLMSNGVPTFGA